MAVYFRSDSSPVTCTAVMVSGPPGVGKGTVIRSVARRCRMNVKEVWSIIVCGCGH